MFSQYDGDSDGAVTINELFQMVKGHRRLADPFGVRSLPSLPFFFLRNIVKEGLTYVVGSSFLRMGDDMASYTKGGKGL